MTLDTNDERRLSQEQIENIDRLLNTALGKGKYPLALVGDLHDLRVSLSRFASELEVFFESRTDYTTEEMEKELFQIRLQCTDIISMIFKDIESGIDEAIGPMEDD